MMQAEVKTLESIAEYSVGWIAASSLEKTAAIAILDQRHTQPLTFAQSNNDTNSYTFGRIGDHNLVIASLPAGFRGLVSATRTALGFTASFPHIRIGLSVGIGAALPESKVNIQLGDVVVGYPDGNGQGVVQYDFRKTIKTGGWELKGTLALPPMALLTALSALQAEHRLEESQMAFILESASKKSPRFAADFGHPGAQHEMQVQGSPKSSGKDTVEVKSKTFDHTPHIYYGTIASGATIVRNAKIRSEIFSSLPPMCLCLDTEAAGSQIDFPCLIIRGISDYADERADDTWQAYACATAAAFAKELLMYLPRKQVDKAQIIREFIKPLQKEIKSMKEDIMGAQRYVESEKKQNRFHK